MAQHQNDQLRNEIIFKRIELLKKETLGIGSYGAVYKAKCDDLLCAAKILHPTLFDPHAKLEIAPHKEHRLPMRRFEQECEFMSAIRHPNIVQYLGTHRDPETDFPVLLMELMDNSLTQFLESSQEPIPFHIQINICHDIAMALSFLHSSDIIHRDLSSNNVLLIGNSRAKVTDFGMAKLGDINPQATHISHSLCPGTEVYMPPEATNEDRLRYTEKIDCFSFGVLGIQILTREFPKPGDRMREEMINGRRMFAPLSEFERRQNHISQVDPNHPLLPIALDCLKDEDVERPSAQELCRRVAALKQTSQYTDSERSVQQHTHQMEDLEQQHAHQIEDLQQQHSSSLQHLRQELRDKEARLETSEQLVATFQTRISELEQLQSIPQTHHQGGAESRANIRLSWKEGENAPCTMYRIDDAVVSGSVVYFKEGNKIYAYNSPDTTWSQLPDCPVGSCSLAMVNNNLTTIGGRGEGQETNHLFSFTGEDSRKKWTEVLPPMPTKRRFPIAICIGAHLIVAGGEIGGRNVTTVEVLNTDTTEWSTAADLPSPLSCSSATIYRDRIYMLGGLDGTGIPTKSVLTCSLSALLQSCHSNFLGARLNTLSLTAFGVTVWSRVADLPVTHSTCITSRGYVLAIGGRDSVRRLASAVHIYNMIANSWEIISHMTTPRSLCYAAILPDHKLLVIGGFTTRDATDIVEIAQSHPRPS